MIRATDRTSPVPATSQPREQAAPNTVPAAPAAAPERFEAAAPAAPLTLGPPPAAHVALPSLAPGAAPQTVKVTAEPGLSIGDNSKVETSLQVTEALDIQKLSLELGIQHSWRGDLVVSVTSPSGKTVVVSDRQGGSADDLRGSFDLSAFAGEPSQGEWKITVEDKARGDVGTFETCALEITGEPKLPDPPPVNDDSDPMKHLEYLASDEMKGRDSPSPEFDQASVYVRDYLQKYGLKGPNAADPQSPFFQTFDLFRFGSERHVHDEQPHSLDPEDFSQPLFAEGHYIDDALSPEDLALLNEKYQAQTLASGAAPIRGTGPNGQLTAAELRDASSRAGTVQNVMGLLEGTGPNKDEVIVVMAHLDHVGVNSRGQVFNGADDNASGSATLLASVPELVQLQKEGKLDRSILFMWTAAEEAGLVGAKYFADHPIPGLGMKEISGVVNLDMVGRWDDQRLSVLDTTNGQANYFRPILEQANNSLEDPFDRINRDINSFKDRQDGAIFSRKGEDVLMLFEGLSNPNGGGQLIPEYHGTGDDVDKIIRDNGGNKVRRIKDLFVQIAQLAANRPAEASAETAETSRAERRRAAPPAVLWR